MRLPLFDGGFDAAALGTLIEAQLTAVGPVLLAVAGAGLLIWGGFFVMGLGKKAAAKGAK